MHDLRLCETRWEILHQWFRKGISWQTGEKSRDLWARYNFKQTEKLGNHQENYSRSLKSSDSGEHHEIRKGFYRLSNKALQINLWWTQ